MAKSAEQLLDTALQFALDAHRGQTDKGGKPYILHPLRLMLKFESIDEQIVAVLHDVIEDSETTFDELTLSGFSETIVQALVCLSKQKSETYDQFIERIKANPLARRIKIEDIKDNLNLDRLKEITQKDMRRAEKYRQALAKLESGI